ncbi:NAD(P)/FAD-dependent oxidoreductase [Epibacterium ulvae]|uniref:NAD(P)/FAD-dependent oxidoreductase n=1 Tax=Epibacterium ulvae TaxID=1156985 RepID=UPI002492B8D6|nr:FAD-binding oxidoreductase [Epibacterium ulvae]
MTQYTVNQLPSLKGAAAWNCILPDLPPETLNQDQTADVVIVGAGFAGLSAARRLHQIEPNARIVVLEAGRLAHSSAGRNSGFMIDLPHDLASDDYAGDGDDQALIVLNRQAIGFAADAVEDYQINRNFFDWAGKINGAASAKAARNNESYARHLQGLGESCELLDAQQMQEITGSAHYVGGLYTPGTVMLQPAGYIRGLATGLRRAGVLLFEEAAVTKLARVSGDWRVETQNAAITAGRVILTVNGHLESFGFEASRLMQVFLFAAMTPELDANTLKVLGGQPRWGITPSDPMGTTIRRIDAGQGGNRLVTRSCAVLRSGMKVSDSDMRRASIMMRRKFDQRFPRLAGMSMEYMWSGHLCLSMNGVSVQRQLDDGLFSGCVQNGLGTTRGTLTGIGAAELACGIASDITKYFTAEPTPRQLPPRPFRDLGANAYMRWKEFQARKE